MNIYYKKNTNSELFDQFTKSDNNYIKIENVQNYIPLYNNFFLLNNTNYNTINSTNHTTIC